MNLSVLAGKHNLGHVTVCVQSRMVQLRCLLQKETSPLKLICNAMGVSGASCSDVEELDSVLARRLTVSQFPSGLLDVMRSDDQATAGELRPLRFYPLLFMFECKTHIHLCVCVSVCVFRCVFMCMCSHICLCMHVYILCVMFMCSHVKHSPCKTMVAFVNISVL